MQNDIAAGDLVGAGLPDGPVILHRKNDIAPGDPCDRYLGPCRGRYFLVSSRKYPKRRLGGRRRSGCQAPKHRLPPRPPFGASIGGAGENFGAWVLRLRYASLRMTHLRCVWIAGGDVILPCKMTGPTGGRSLRTILGSRFEVPGHFSFFMFHFSLR